MKLSKRAKQRARGRAKYQYQALDFEEHIRPGEREEASADVDNEPMFMKVRNAIAKRDIGGLFSITRLHGKVPLRTFTKKGQVCYEMQFNIVNIIDSSKHIANSLSKAIMEIDIEHAKKEISK